MGTTSPLLTTIKKRNGDIVAFEELKIENAVKKALTATGESGCDAKKIADITTAHLSARMVSDSSFVPTVESVQDAVETALMEAGCTQTAKAYILFRAKRAEEREKREEVPEKVRLLAKESKEYFKDNPLGEFVYLRTYARWIETENRRETWVETVDRYIEFMRENLGEKLSEGEYSEVRGAILRQEIMPSMRLMQFAGEAARRCNTCAYNCTFTAPSSIEDIAEIMYLSMQGCGVGFSVESATVEQLPQIKKQTGKKLDTHVIVDSKEGWCDALKTGMRAWYEGADIEFDYSLIRPAGARLKVMGGKASGPEPLRSLLTFTRERILSRQGRRLHPIDAHDIICKIGECVVAGGVRRTAMISLSDLDDAELRDAKKGPFYTTDPHRMVANNSAVYESRPSSVELMEEWVALMKSGSGERGIFNRGALQNTIPERRRDYWKSEGFIGEDGVVVGPIGTNPCGEILLQSKQFCNLSEVIARHEDTRESLLQKVRLASLVGTYQATLVKFNYISPEWKAHCEAESLLGVSITGQWDSPASRDPETLRALRDEAVKTNEEYARRFGIARSMSVTAVKPSGTVSQTFNCASGIHPRHSQYYIRRVRISATDSLFKMLKAEGVPYHPEVGQNEATATTFVLEFPVKSPDSEKFKDDLTAIDQLEYWKRVKLNFTEHNPSATISIGEDEWIGVVSWLQQNWDIIGGLSFLPRFDHVYLLAPYEAISKERYESMKATFPDVDFSKHTLFEKTDETEQKKELACVGGTCDIDGGETQK